MSKRSFKKFQKLLLPKMTWGQIIIGFCLELITIALVGLLYRINSDGRLALVSSLTVLLISEDVFEYFGNDLAKPTISKDHRRIVRILWLNTVLSIEIVQTLWDVKSSTNLFVNLLETLSVAAKVMVTVFVVMLVELIIVRGMPIVKKFFQNSED